MSVTQNIETFNNNSMTSSQSSEGKVNLPNTINNRFRKITIQADMIHQLYNKSKVKVQRIIYKPKRGYSQKSLTQPQLIWQGEYTQNMKKIGRGRQQCGDNTGFTQGWYSSDGLRVGPWKLPIYNFWNSKPLVYEVGEYCDNQKQGRWNYIMNNQIIGGGCYEEECTGLKTGNWIELDDDMNNIGQVMQEGQYIHGIKVGVWKKIKKEHQQNYIH